jgi:pSer/pThr/pTyr-binding forkhead associated (FHA) protein
MGLAPIRQALAGALGGMLGFVLFEPGTRTIEVAAMAGESADPSAIISTIVAVFAYGAIVTAVLVIADELPSGRIFRVLFRGFVGAAIGMLVGTLSYVLASCLFGIAMLAAAGFTGVIGQILGRTFAWGAFGTGIGLSAGLVSGGGRRVSQGCLGGLIGGCIGGFLFDVLALTGAGTLSRLVGFTAIGAFVGLATAVVEQIARVAWITVLTGAREGRQIVLHRDEVVLGRDELVDIPLFGDHRVERRHAVLSLTPAPVVREIGTSALMKVDGQATREAVLYDGADVQIGKHRLRFHHRHAAATRFAAQEHGTILPPVPEPVPVPAVSAPPRPVMSAPAAGFPAFGGETETIPAPAPAVPYVPGGALALRVVNGEPAGLFLPLRNGGVSIGREVDNTLPLSDAKISRRHARIEPVEGSWVLTDLGSTNGTRLNGLRVTRAGLQPGDYIYLGDTVLAVEAA